jgi:hypothetical protein
LRRKPKPPYYELEFSSDATFWTEGDASSRRTYFMPVPTPSEFLAFGVLVPSKKVIFVARGRVREEMSGFIDRMVRDEATVELYAKPPLPASFVNDYVKGPPHEGHEYDLPPDPSNPGLTATPGTMTTQKQKQKQKQDKDTKPKTLRSSARR